MKQDPNYQRIARKANKLGSEGIRVLSVTVIPAEATGGEDIIEWVTDYGPSDATEDWD